ncbi:MFS transporter [Paenibacillus sp. FSL R7-0297]|uniref:MFS transporter n=1 Tax=Paenibacillus sp. FSL R7-0297 TaxID=2921680 RepID=UPI0030FB6793
MNIRFTNPRMLLPLGVLITNIGNGMYTLAVGKLLYDQTGSSTPFALLLMMEAVLTFSTQAIASSAVDRGRAKQCAFIAESIRGLAVLTAAAFVFAGHPASILLAAVIINLLRPFYRTASFAIGPMIADGKQLAVYNARTSTFFQIGQFLGAGIAGVVISFLSPEVAIALNGISYLLSALCIGLAAIPGQKLRARQGSGFGSALASISPKRFWREWTDLLALVLRKNAKVLGLAVLCTADFIVVSFINISYAPILETMDAPSWWLSIWDSAFSIGAIAGAYLFGRMDHSQIRMNRTALALVVQGLNIAAIGLMNHPVWLSPLMLFLGVSNAFSVSSFTYSLQLTAPAEFHGRISGIRQFFISAATMLVIPLLSFAMNGGVSLSSLLAGVICLGVASVVLLYLSPLLSRPLNHSGSIAGEQEVS